MAAETKRRIINLGGSGVIAIPPDFRRYYGLKPGSEVRVLYDSVLLIVPSKCEQKLKEKEELVRRLLE